MNCPYGFRDRFQRLVWNACPDLPQPEDRLPVSVYRKLPDGFKIECIIYESRVQGIFGFRGCLIFHCNLQRVIPAQAGI